MAVSQYMEDPSSEVNIDLSNTKRKYQTSNIIVQDPQKEGILSFLKENFSTPVVQTQSSPGNQTQTQSFRPSQDNTTGNY